MTITSGTISISLIGTSKWRKLLLYINAVQLWIQDLPKQTNSKRKGLLTSVYTLPEVAALKV